LTALASATSQALAHAQKYNLFKGLGLRSTRKPQQVCDAFNDNKNRLLVKESHKRLLSWWIVNPQQKKMNKIGRL